MDDGKTVDRETRCRRRRSPTSCGAADAVAARRHAGARLALSPEELEQLTADIVAALKTVYDPEIPSDIYELGLIYKIDIDDDRNVPSR